MATTRARQMRMRETSGSAEEGYDGPASLAVRCVTFAHSSPIEICLYDSHAPAPQHCLPRPPASPGWGRGSDRAPPTKYGTASHSCNKAVLIMIDITFPIYYDESLHVASHSAVELQSTRVKTQYNDSDTMSLSLSLSSGITTSLTQWIPTFAAAYYAFDPGNYQE